MSITRGERIGRINERFRIEKKYCEWNWRENAVCDWCERVGEWEGRMGCIRKGSNGNERCKWKIMSWVIKRGEDEKRMEWMRGARVKSVKEAKRLVNEKGYNGVSEGGQVRCVKEAMWRNVKWELKECAVREWGKKVE